MCERARLPADPSLTPGAAPRRWMPTLAAGLSLGEYARSLVRRLAFLTAVLLVAIWALDGPGLLLARLGLAGARSCSVLLDFTAGWAWRRPPGAVRRVACVWALVSVGGRDPRCRPGCSPGCWPACTSSGPPGRCSALATAGSAYSLIALHDRVLVARGRRALRARIDLLTRTRRQAVDAQAAELRRIERDLHDGAQARLVALTLQLGRAELRAEEQPEVRRLIGDAQREAHHAIAELRDLARGIVPPLLADRGLVAAVESLAARYGLGTAIAGEHRVAASPRPSRAPPTS